MNRIVHYEFSGKKIAELKNFYEKVFQWRFDEVGKSDYWLVDSSDKGISVGLEKQKAPLKNPLVYIDVDSVENTVKEVIRNGGKVVIAKTQFLNKGLYAVIADIEGNLLGIWERVNEK
jgi:predicted enzyme related to lactoylglutathione lyase